MEENKVRVTVTVTNTGARAGKEVAQLYVSVPCGALPQPYQTLAAFSKTKELTPGESETLALCFAMEELASFDEESCCAVLEKGNYVLHLGADSRSTSVCAVVRLEEDVLVQHLHDAGGKPDFADWQPEHRKTVHVPEGTPCLEMKASAIREIIPTAPAIDEKAAALAASMTDSDLALLCTGAYNGAAGSNSVIGNAGVTVIGSAGETTGIFPEIPALIMADGPAGVRIAPKYGVDEKGPYSLDNGAFSEVLDLIPDEVIAALGFSREMLNEKRSGTVHEQYCTAFPVGTALAQSWDPDLLAQVGRAVSREMDEFHVDLWLAPGMNIQRNPLCGRNFEYYSEDPLLTGTLAAAITAGVQESGRHGVTLKHFACNNQEDNRMAVDARVSERALWEIYLRGFEIAVKTAAPAAVMSAYNCINGVHAANSRDLCTVVLRQEWGFAGLVMSDWNTTVPQDGSTPWRCAWAGNDVIMPGNPHDDADIRAALADGRLPETAARQSAARLIALASALRGG